MRAQQPIANLRFWLSSSTGIYHSISLHVRGKNLELESETLRDVDALLGNDDTSSFQATKSRTALNRDARPGVTNAHTPLPAPSPNPLQRQGSSSLRCAQVGPSPAPFGMRSETVSRLQCGRGFRTVRLNFRDSTSRTYPCSMLIRDVLEPLSLQHHWPWQDTLGFCAFHSLAI